MSNYHLFAGARFDTSGGMDEYRGLYETPEQAYGAAIDYDWAELAVTDDDGRLVKFAVRDEEIVDFGEYRRKRSIGWRVGTEFLVMEIKNERWKAGSGDSFGPGAGVVSALRSRIVPPDLPQLTGMVGGAWVESDPF